MTDVNASMFQLLVTSTLAVGAMDVPKDCLSTLVIGEQTYQNNGILALGDNLQGAAPGGDVTTKMWYQLCHSNRVWYSLLCS